MPKTLFGLLLLLSSTVSHAQFLIDLPDANSDDGQKVAIQKSADEDFRGDRKPAIDPDHPLIELEIEH